jgi:signal transduction histidine kinase/CheY-like chemotaxis protein
MADHRSKLATIVREHEPQILSEWIDLLAKAGGRGGVERAEVEAHARTFVRLLADALQADGSGGIDGPEWTKVRDMLATLSSSRTRHGSSPTETATFVFSLKQPLFARLQSEYRADAEGLARELWTATLLLDKLGLLTTEPGPRRRLNAELQDTNRGVLALYAELDDKADTLRRADEMKSRFLSNMSHEFRTPLNSMMALSRLLLEDVESPLTAEQRRQVGYIRRASEDLTELVNDLLDLAKVEAGKIVIRAADFDLRDLFAGLRGMLRPLLLNESVNLVFEEPEGLPLMHTDEGKVSQILRNLLSNALKFTERGEIRLSARPAGDGMIAFSVADTGIGIAPEDQQRIFEEFGQIENPVQRRVRGTGLGLPLVRRLATLLGGGIAVESTPGVGSTFTTTVPVRYPVEAESGASMPAEAAGAIEPGRVPVLVVEDSAQDLLLYEHYFRDSPFQAVAARTLPDARRLIEQLHPVAMVLDIRLQGEDAWAFISEVRRREDTRAMAVVVVSSIDDQAKGLTLGADAYAIKPVHPAWLLGSLTRLLDRGRGRRVLVIDDDEISRYLVRSHLAGAAFDVREAVGPVEGLRDARAERPDAIVLDLVMPEMSGFDVLARLKEDPATMDIPVVVLTSKTLSDDERRRLAPHAFRILSKQALADGVTADDLRAALSAPATGEAVRD